MKNYRLERVHLTSYYLLHLLMEHSKLVHRKFIIVIVCSCILLASKLEDMSIRIRRLLGYVQQLKWVVSGNEWVLEEIRTRLLKEAETEFSLTPEVEIRNTKRKLNTPVKHLIQHFEVHLFSLLWSCQQCDDEHRPLKDLMESENGSFPNETLADYRSGVLPLDPIYPPSTGSDKPMHSKTKSSELRSQYHETCYTHSPLCLLQDVNLLVIATEYYTNHLEFEKYVHHFTIAKCNEQSGATRYVF